MLRSNSYTDKTGTSAYNLINCAKKYGFTGSGIRVNNIRNIKENILPCIAHLCLKNGLNHFVVIYKITTKHLLVMDPSKGKVKMSIYDFNNVFSGVIILLQPINKIVKLNRPKTISSIIVDLMRENRVKTLILILISIFLIVLSLILSYFIKIGKVLIDKKIGFEILILFSVLYLTLYIIKNIFDYIKNRCIISFNKNVSIKLFDRFSSDIFSLPLNFIRSRTSGEVISRFNELSEVNSLLPNIILSVSLDLIMSIITMIFLISISFKLTIITLIFMLLYLATGYAFKNPTLRKINKNLDLSADFNSSVIESINNLRSIKNLNNEDNMRKRMNRYSHDAINDNYTLDCFHARTTFIKNIIYDLMIVFISSYGLYLISISKLNIVDLFTFIMITSYFTEPIKDLIDMITKYCFIKNSINKINEFSIVKEDGNNGKEFNPGDIKICNLSYAYNGINYIIRNYSCLIKNRSKVLLQGSSGSGKSTLCQIISKQLMNYDGEIYINNNKLCDLNNKSVYKNITYIGQKDSLIIDTIENNIKYERNIDNKEFTSICRICEIDKIVGKKINNFNSIISESSDNISGGEKQRIVLARGLLNSGNILILDESLSEVNKDMEERIVKRIIKYFKDKTIIYVSHKNYKNIFDKVVKI